MEKMQLQKNKMKADTDSRSVESQREMHEIDSESGYLPEAADGLTVPKEMNANDEHTASSLKSSITMNEVKSTRSFSSSFQPDSEITNRKKKKLSITGLEPLYDILYVAVSRMLPYPDPTYVQIFKLTALMITSWWSWFMVTLYDTKYDMNNAVHRVGKLVQMFGVSGFALSIKYAFETSAGSDMFVISYMIIRAVLLFNYGLVIYNHIKSKKEKSEENAPDRPGHHLIDAITDRYLWKTTWPVFWATLSSLLLFGISIIINDKLWARSLVWLVSVIIDFCAHTYIICGKDRVEYSRVRLSKRMGFMTNVIIGECVIGFLEATGARVGLAAASMNLAMIGKIVGIAVVMMALFFCFWIMYLDNMSEEDNSDQSLIQRLSFYDRHRFTWIYIHMPLHLFIGLLGIFMHSSLKFIFDGAYTPTPAVNQTSVNGTIFIRPFVTNVTAQTEPMKSSSSISAHTSETDIGPGLLASEILFTFAIVNCLFSLIYYLNRRHSQSMERSRCHHRALLVVHILCSVVPLVCMAIPDEIFDNAPTTSFVYLLPVLTAMQLSLVVFS